MRDHVIVCGLGNVGWRIVQLLHRLGERAAVITLAPREEWAREAQGLGALLLIGDARDQQLLIEAGLMEARALLVVTDVDVVNIEIVLDARKLRADIPIVVRLFDQALARQLEKTSDVRRALSTSVLSAPVFAAAALGKQVIGTFSLDEHPYVIGRIEVTEGLLCEVPTIGDLAERRGVAVINLHRGGDEVKELTSEVTLCAGDRLAVVAAQHAWEQVVGGEVTPPPSRLPEMLQPQHLREVAGHAWRQSPLLLRLALLVFVTINLLAVEIFHRGLALSYVDALYLVVSTVTTVGYGDVTPRHDNEALELFGCLLMLLGTALMAVLYSIITDFVVASRFEQLVAGRRRVPRKDHVVVVGAGTIGYRVIKELHRARIPLVVIDAGHGGRDPGAGSGPVREKDLTLALSRAVRDDLLRHLRRILIELG